MGKNHLFKALLIAQAMLLLVYTLVIYPSEGGNLFSVFISNVQSLTWSGQFNLDFLCYLILSGLWIMWRHQFSGRSIITGITAMILGIIFFAPYILWIIQKENGNLKRVFIGDR